MKEKKLIQATFDCLAAAEDPLNCMEGIIDTLLSISASSTPATNQAINFIAEALYDNVEALRDSLNYIRDVNLYISQEDNKSNDEK